jgi:hypothetical protein
MQDMVDTVKVALVAPAGTVTLAGTVAAEALLLASATSAPPAGAAALSVTVPVDPTPPVTLVGFRLRDETVIGITVSAPDLVAPPYVPEIVTEVDAETGFVQTAKVAFVVPSWTTTLAGTPTTAGMLLDSMTATPPAGAGPLSVAAPVEALPAVTVAGLTSRAMRVVAGTGGVNVSVAELVMPP